MNSRSIQNKHCISSSSDRAYYKSYHKKSICVNSSSLAEKIQNSKNILWMLHTQNLSFYGRLAYALFLSVCPVFFEPKQSSLFVVQSFVLSFACLCPHFGISFGRRTPFVIYLCNFIDFHIIFFRLFAFSVYIFGCERTASVLYSIRYWIKVAI